MPERLHPFAANEGCVFQIAFACGTDVVALHVVGHPPVGTARVATSHLLELGAS